MAGDAVALGGGQQHAVACVGRHALLHERFQPARPRIEQADLDDIVMQQVAGETANVLLEQLDAIGDAHVGEMISRQGGQFAAGPVQRVELLLLLHERGDITAQGEEQGFRAIRLAYGRDVQVDDPAIAAMQPGSHGLRRIRGGVKEAGIGGDQAGAAQRLVKIAAGRGSAAPRLECRIGPAHTQVGIDHGHAIGQRGEDVLRLHQRAQAAQHAGVGRIGQQSIKELATELLQPGVPGVRVDDVAVQAATPQPVRIGAGGVSENQKPGSIGHEASPRDSMYAVGGIA